MKSQRLVPQILGLSTFPLWVDSPRLGVIQNELPSSRVMLKTMGSLRLWGAWFLFSPSTFLVLVSPHLHIAARLFVCFFAGPNKFELLA